MKIYTKNGDQGETCLIGGKKTPKWNDQLEAYGTLDELNSHIGLLESLIKEKENKKSLSFLNIEEQTFYPFSDKLHLIQNQLFNLGSLLAAANPLLRGTLPQIQESDIFDLESEIDQMEANLKPLKSFILPGGSVLSAQAHICRTVCRRAERQTLKAFIEMPPPELAIPYLNRLSDYFFVFARTMIVLEQKVEREWKK